MKLGLVIVTTYFYSVVETTFNCEESKKSIYRTYSNFSQKDFQGDLLLNIGDGKND